MVLTLAAGISLAHAGFMKTSSPWSWRQLGGLNWPLLKRSPNQPPRHPLPHGCGAECDSKMERLIIQLTHELRKATGGPSVPELVAHLTERGVKCNQRSVRECISHLVNDHMLPLVASPEQGVRIASGRGELESARDLLRAQAAEVMARAANLDGIISIYCDQDISPFTTRLDQYGTPNMSKADTKRKRKRIKRDENAKKNASRPDAPDALETAISNAFNQLCRERG